jgi:hypothetical protein
MLDALAPETVHERVDPALAGREVARPWRGETFVARFAEEGSEPAEGRERLAPARFFEGGAGVASFARSPDERDRDAEREAGQDGGGEGRTLEAEHETSLPARAEARGFM